MSELIEYVWAVICTAWPAIVLMGFVAIPMLMYLRSDILDSDEDTKDEPNP